MFSANGLYYNATDETHCSKASFIINEECDLDRGGLTSNITVHNSVCNNYWKLLYSLSKS